MLSFKITFEVEDKMLWAGLLNFMKMLKMMF